MIGQQNNINKIFQWKINKSLPRFILISGEQGSGRLTLAKSISKSISCTPVIVENSVDEVRQTIQSSYSVKDTTMYIFRNVDTMRAEAKNALLKVTEEPPNNAYFIMTLERPENTLETIMSRSVQLQIEPYTNEEWSQFNFNVFDVPDNMTPGQAKMWEENGNYPEFLAFVTRIKDNLKTMYGTEILQISNELNCKNNDKGYDCIQFVKTLYRLLPVNVDIARLTTNCINDLKRTGLKKSGTIDLYLLQLKEYL